MVCLSSPALPVMFANKIEALIRSFIWTGKLEKLALDEIKNTREEGGLNVVCVKSKADALFLRQTCRLLANGNVFPDMRHGPHAVTVALPL